MALTVVTQIARIVYFIVVGVTVGYGAAALYVYHRLPQRHPDVAWRVRWHVPLTAAGVVIVIASDVYEHASYLAAHSPLTADLPVHLVATGLLGAGLRSLVQRSLRGQEHGGL